MVIDNDIVIDADLGEVLTELQSQLKLNGINLLSIVRNSGDDFMVSCPYHKDGQERRPSAGIRKSDGLFHCLACGETHQLTEVISYCFGHYDDAFGSFGRDWIKKNFASYQMEVRKDVKLDFTRNRNTTVNVNHREYVTDEELDRYRYTHPYWAERGIVDYGILELFDLGYDKETQCITFPVKDRNGNCLFVARRSVHTKYFNYPSGVEKPLYGAYELRLLSKCSEPNEIYVTESMIDCLLLWQAGRYAVALNGTGSKEQLEMLKKLPYRKLVLATDNDKAGYDARKKIKRAITNKVITEVEIPNGKKDIGECTKEEIENLKEIF